MQIGYIKWGAIIIIIWYKNRIDPMGTFLPYHLCSQLGLSN